MTTTSAAAALRNLHVPGRPLVLPNAWNAASARAVEAAGFSAVATSSAAVSEVLGHEDGHATPVEDVLASVTHIVRAVDVPVTVDFERGYGLGPDELVARLAETGAVGANLEDSDPATGAMVSIDDQAEFLAEVRAASVRMRVDIVLNARIDCVLRGGPSKACLTDTVERAAAYLAAGVDCIYPIGVTALADIARLVEGVDSSVNVGFAGTATIEELAALGVARISFGPRLQRHVYAGLGTLLGQIAESANVVTPASPTSAR